MPKKEESNGLTKTTYEKLIRFLQIGQSFLNRDPSNKNRKIGRAIMRVANRVNTSLDEYRAQLEVIDIENCSTDDTGIILRKDNEYQFSKEDMRKRIAQRRDLLTKRVVHIKPEFTDDIPNSLTLIEVDAFAGIVIPESYVLPEGDKTSLQSDE